MLTSDWIRERWGGCGESGAECSIVNQAEAAALRLQESIQGVLYSFDVMQASLLRSRGIVRGTPGDTPALNPRQSPEPQLRT